jgi:hypothetical protein
MDIASLKDLIEGISALTEKSINTRIEQSLKNLSQRSSPQRSELINELAAALAKAQSEMSTATTSSDNPYFKTKYADLTAIVNASRPALTKNGLAVVQQIVLSDDGSQVLSTVMTHSSGQWIESRMRIIPPKNDVQSIGSYITYLRRYSYAALVGVVAADEDDDGERVMDRIRSDLSKPNINSYRGKNQAVEVVTKEQIEELEYELKDSPKLAEDIMEGLHIQSLSDMPKELYNRSIRRIREIKAASTASKP